ncbi:MAG: sigma-54 dependent transcriptional regulator [Desulfobulbaceae bacterium]|nr:sigma-54 dependent transcriptional regulator [Desulfobulbaceae bacterium]
MGNEMKQPVVLVVEDSEVSRRSLEHKLVRSGFLCLTANDGVEALEILGGENNIDLILSDQQMPRMDGLTLLQEVKKNYSHLPFILLTGHGNVTDAVYSLKEGADDYLEKPFDPENLIATIRRSLSIRQMQAENIKLKEHLSTQHSFQNIRTSAPAMINALGLASKVAKIPHVTVAISGESGTGKEVLARAIHFAGDGLENRFVAVNCAAIPATLIESELFGHARGAFTGADREREGKFSYAGGGTLLLDEIGDMPLDMQTKLLRVLEERTFEMVGSNRPCKVECRVIVATHNDLAALVREGKFREDLFHRISAFPIVLPPLRERREDVPLLVNYFLEQLREQLGKKVPEMSEMAMDRLQEYNWPGNIRELKNCIERAAILAEGSEIGTGDIFLPTVVAGQQDPGSDIAISLSPEEFTLDNVISATLRLALKRCGNNKTRAAEMLQIDRKMFYRR